MIRDEAEAAQVVAVQVVYYTPRPHCNSLPAVIIVLGDGKDRDSGSDNCGVGDVASGSKTKEEPVASRVVGEQWLT